MDFDAETLDQTRLHAKAHLRRRMRSLRRAIPLAALQARSERIVRTIVESQAFEHAKRVALFASIVKNHEVDLRALDLRSRELGKAVLFPMLDAAPGSMSLRYANWEQLVERGHGFAEPKVDATVAETGPDLLIVVPALAVSADGQRIGYGKGYYDRLLSRMAPPAVSMAVAFDFQLVAEVPATIHDWTVDWIATDARFFRAARPRGDERLPRGSTVEDEPTTR